MLKGMLPWRERAFILGFWGLGSDLPVYPFTFFFFHPSTSIAGLLLFLCQWLLFIQCHPKIITCLRHITVTSLTVMKYYVRDDLIWELLRRPQMALRMWPCSKPGWMKLIEIFWNIKSHIHFSISILKVLYMQQILDFDCMNYYTLAFWRWKSEKCCEMNSCGN